MALDSISNLLAAADHTALTGASSFAAPSASQTVLLSIAVAGLALALGSGVQKFRRSRRNRTPLRVGPHDDPTAIHSSTIREVEEIMTQLDDVARRVHTRLDMKLASLEMLIHEADQRIEKLSRTVATVEVKPAIDVTLSSETPFAESPRSTSDSVQLSVFRLFDRGRTPLEIAQETGKTTGEIELMLALRRTRADAEKKARV